MKINLLISEKKSEKLWLLVLLLLTVSILKGQEYPNPDWHYIDKPEQAGWNKENSFSRYRGAAC